MDWIEIRYGEVSMFSILNPFQEELTLKNDWIREWLIQLVLIFDIHTTRMWWGYDIAFTLKWDFKLKCWSYSEYYIL